MAKNTFISNSKDGEDHSAKKIAFVHYKGGTGKTTSCLNIAGWLTKMDKKVLVVDLDPQGNATAGLGVNSRLIENSIYDVLLYKKDIMDVILKTDSGVFLVPSSLDLLAIGINEKDLLDNSNNLKEHLARVEKHFNYILIDAPPGSTMLMINGIVASGNIIVPLDSGVFAYEAMETLKELIIDLNEANGIETNIMMALLREFSQSDIRVTGRIKKLLKEFFIENGIPGVKTFTIPFSDYVYKAQMKGVPISHYAKYSNVGRRYKKIAKEVLSYWEIE